MLRIEAALIYCFRGQCKHRTIWMKKMKEEMEMELEKENDVQNDD